MIREKKKKKPYGGKLCLFPLLLLGLFALAGAQRMTPQGQGNVAVSPVTWTTGANTKTRLLFLANNVYLDTSATGQTNAWKRIDNTADSCSNAFFLASDSNGTARPVWEYRLWGVFRSVDKDSSTHTYRVQTRERFYDGATRKVFWRPWTIKGANNGYSDVTIQDSVLIANATVTTKISQYALFSVAGSQARLCPDDNASTANAAADSVFADSLVVYTR